jgi:L-cysteine:1D-myo-inositol 2-amino-2-deoxy-alpha-D-glucopyranoside ligase
MKNWPEVFIPAVDGRNLPKLRLFDTNLGRSQIEVSDIFKMYVCGITPYDATHLGHAATYLAFDLINRFQRSAGYEVDFIENVTDIDDPLLERANRDKVDWQELAQLQIELFKSDMSLLRILPPKNLVKVTDAILLVEKFMDLLDKNGFLYTLEADLYFDSSKFLNDMKLSHTEAIKIFAERGGDPDRIGKKHPLDPVVWVGNNAGEPGWESKYGFGRPGWHIECTAIACEYLWTSKSSSVIDLQGGGSDLIFPHHFMSAQIVKAAHNRDFSKHFIHTGMISLGGEKMSKSKGNLVLVSKLIAQGIEPMIIRWALLSGHYQQDRSWSDDLIKTSTIEIEKVRRCLSRSETADATELISAIGSDLANNLDTPSALNRLVLWAESSDLKHNHAGMVSRTIDALLGLAL